MGVIEAIKKGFGVASKNMGLVLVLFLFNLIGNLASMPFAAATPGAEPAPQLTAMAIVFSVAFILISIFIQGGTLGLIRDVMKEGAMKLGAMAKYGAKYYVRLLLLGILIVLIISVVALVAGLLIAATAPLNNPVVTTVAVVIAVVIALTAALMFFIPFTLSPYAIVCDEVGVIEALKKSLKVARTPFSKVLTLLLLIVVLVLIALGIGFIVGFLVGIIAAVIPAGAGRILMMAVTSAINGYLGVVITTSFMTYYLTTSK